MKQDKLDLGPICMRARSYAARGHVEDALDLYADVLKVDPEYALAYADRGTVLAMTKQFMPAMQDLERAFALGYSDASAFSTAGTICLETGHFDKALDYFGRSLQLNRDYPFTYFNRASVHAAMGNRNAAIEDLEDCLRMGPEDDFKELILQRLASLQKASSAG